MPFESGGIADKLGNRYESRWIAKQLLSLLNEEIQSVTIEAIGEDNKGVDLWILGKNGIRQAHQCKARNASKEYWDITDLASRGVLHNLQFQLNRDPSYEFVFVSSVDSELFKSICDYARRSDNNPVNFYQDKILRQSKDVQTCFKKFCDNLSLDPDDTIDLAQAFDYLKRTYIFDYPDDHGNWQNLLDSANYRLVGTPETIVSTILTYAENKDRFGNPIYTDELEKYLKENEIHPKGLAHDSRIAPAIQELQHQFSDSIKPLLISNSLIRRQETSRLIEAAETGENVILSGAAGYGKSGVLFELTEYLQANNIPHLPIRLDRREPRNTAAQFGKDLGLPDCPVFSLSGLAGERKSVLILDQLDAIRWTSAHSDNALDICKELVRHIKTLRLSDHKIVIVLSCRTFDLEHDPSIRNWLAGETEMKFTKILVKELPGKTLQEIIGSLFSQMTEKEKSLLACPQNLSIWMELKRHGAVPLFRTATDLMREFWKNRRQILNKRACITPDQVDQVLTPIIEYIEHNGKISAPERIIDLWPTTVEALCSYGILQRNAGRISFCHQRHLDYLIAERLLRQIDNSTGNILTWLGVKERQSLFRREQLRQALVMMSEESPSQFTMSAQQLLESEEIRFHIKHLVLELMGSLDEVSDELGEYCPGLLQDNFWREHLLETVFAGHPPYVLFLCGKGIIGQWLDSENDESIKRALWLLRSVAEKMPDTVTDMLEPYVEKGGAWPERILDAISWKIEDDSERMFQLRLRLVRLGTVVTFVDWKSLCARDPIRAIQLIEAVLATFNYDEPKTSPKNRLEKLYDHEVEALKTVVEKYPQETLNHLIFHIERLTKFETDPYDSYQAKWREPRYRDVRDTEFAHGVVELTILAGKKIAESQVDLLLAWTRPLEASSSPIIREILIEVYKHLPPDHADTGITWLLGDTSRFRLGPGFHEPEWRPAVRLISNLSPYCSEELFRRLEDAIIHYHSPDEKREAECYLGDWKTGYFGHYWGQTQYFLLPTLAAERIKPSTRALIQVLQRKFANHSEEDFLWAVRGRGGWIGSKLDPSLNKIKDRA